MFTYPISKYFRKTKFCLFSAKEIKSKNNKNDFNRNNFNNFVHYFEQKAGNIFKNNSECEMFNAIITLCFIQNNYHQAKQFSIPRTKKKQRKIPKNLIDEYINEGKICFFFVLFRKRRMKEK